MKTRHVLWSTTNRTSEASSSHGRELEARRSHEHPPSRRLSRAPLGVIIGRKSSRAALSRPALLTKLGESGTAARQWDPRGPDAFDADTADARR